MFTRRAFLKSGSLAVCSLSVGGSPIFLNRAAQATSGKRRILVALFQRGAMDGLMAVSPLNDPRLKKMRPRLAMLAGRRQGANALIDLDGRFGMHPDLAPLERFYREGRLAVVHGVGSPNPTRSHDIAQNCLEEGIADVMETTPAQLNLAGRADSGSRTGPEQNCSPGPGVEYPRSVLGDSLKQIAALIKAGVGLEIAFAESTGWDTHVQQGTGSGTFAQRARDLSGSIAAFWKDVELHQDRVVLMTMTEFGRTVHENGSGGTDHGRASCLFVLGNQVDGGKVHGSIPELDPDALDDGRDLPVTTDFRAVFSEVTSKHLGLGKDNILFPGLDWRSNAVDQIMKPVT